MRRKSRVLSALRAATAVLLLSFSVIGTAGSMPCLFGMPMKQVVEAPVEVPEPASCCPSKEPAPKPEPEKSKCCCVEVLQQGPSDLAISAAPSVAIEFAILPDVWIAPHVLAPIESCQQIRWPEVHGPPGIDLGRSSPRAPPAA